MAQATSISIETTVDVPMATAWKIWNDPAHIMQWNSAHPSWHSPRSENDLRVGGKFNHRMEARDGSFGFDFAGTYDKVELHKEISYTLGDGRKATTLFAEQNGKTAIATTFDAESENDPEFQKQGWQAILDNFKKYAETNA